ncbi:glutamate-5-semialdehyde dehydrogenase [Campylobacter sp. MG1]|uniref:glutamate-5-semialdehyde dehydrogenase n=1 Tax=Campylobacter sp. MG1 TaxID=2976332 RepID=UPI00226CAFAC|nr:glutamate-5-semialdehyde dehydrogenase [Campylobacter sp. MG1]
MLEEICKNSKKASLELAKLDSKNKNEILFEAAKNLKDNMEYILNENLKDIKYAKEIGLKDSLIDRLKLDEKRINSMVLGIQKIAYIPDPLNEYIEQKILENGLIIGKKRVPMGVIGIIYEARPNVTSDAFAMCIKAGSSVILKGGKEALNSNKAIVKILRESIVRLGFNENFVNLITDSSRDTTNQFMRMNKYVNLLIPRGGASLINAVVNNSSIPVIETGVGNCHIYVDESANIIKAIDIIKNAKMQRPSVCNALETLILHKSIIDKIMPELIKLNIDLRCDEYIKSIYPIVNLAKDEDFENEFLDYILAIKSVNNFDEAILHIQKYSTGHSDGIITQNYSNANKFCDLIDSAVVYVNASTRFSDGECFGLGAEIGISTQKLHARGPMGLKEITSYKYIVLGDGQIRD